MQKSEMVRVVGLNRHSVTRNGFWSVASTSSATPARHRSQLLDALMLHLGSRRTIKNLSVDQL